MSSRSVGGRPPRGPAAVALALTVALCASAGATPAVVMISDFDVGHASVQRVVRDELVAMLGQDHGVEVRSAGGDPARAAALLGAAYAEPAVRVVMGVGVASTVALLARPSYPKPTFALGVVDPALQKAPTAADGTTGVRNFNYAVPPTDVGRDLALLHGIRPFSHLAVIGPPGAERVFPGLQTFVTDRLPDAGARVTFVSVAPDGTLAELPPDADAAYVLPLPMLDDDGRRAVYARLRDLGLPSVALAGRPEVALGA